MPRRSTYLHRSAPHLPRWPLALLLLLWLAGCAGPDLATRDDGNLSMERAMILSEARQALGTPYRFGGDTPRGLDCSGLVQLAYARAGISVPRTSRRQFETLPPIDEARPGDLLFFDTAGDGNASHVGIYLGHDQMIHAPGRGRRVTTTPVGLEYWQKRYLGAAAPAP
ncbi:C40 family peptidase [Halomonas caseinilytica]|uniref:NlpC/P60 family protein n=1 Tax=Halomonas caseinilytica TaxID=438744 RepID=A0A1M7APH3_9GAMM|nr:C40 family peptidase [Halomonas caseinilytica]SHL44578.1 NlpC/P60 family protein [Halomonas caseinilytica]